MLPRSPPQQPTEGTRSGNDLTSKITYTSTVQDDGDSGGNVTPTGNWTPPACWYEPRSAQEFSKYVENSYNETMNPPGQHSYAKTTVGKFRDQYKDGKYQNYNLAEADKGN